MSRADRSRRNTTWLDSRGVSEIIGALFVFALVIALLTIWQTQIVPNQNADIEFEHHTDLGEEMVDVRTAVISTANGNQQTASVTLGVRYPSRLIAINAPPSTGILQTTELREFEVRDSNGEAVTTCTGTNEMRFLEYSPSYNYIDTEPTTRYENTVVYREFAEANITLTEQRLVNGDTVNIVALRNEFVRSGSGRVTFEPRRGFTTPTIVEDPEIELPTRLDQQTWEELLEDEFDGPLDEIEHDGETITLRFDGEVRVNCGQVGANDTPPTGGPGDDFGSGASNEINPTGPGALELVETDSSGNQNIDSLTATFENNGETVNITQARIPFYYDASPTGQDPPDTVTLSDGGTEFGTVNAPNGFEVFDEAIRFDGGAQRDVTFEFDSDARGGDWFVFDVVLDTGQRVQYFVSVGELANGGNGQTNGGNGQTNGGNGQTNGGNGQTNGGNGQTNGGNGQTNGGELSADFTYTRSGQSDNVDLDGSSSTGDIQSYEWDIGDDGTTDETGAQINGATVPPGTDVRLTVTSVDGDTDSVVNTVE